VQEVGPERFGIVCVDCAKHRSRWAVRNFYGRPLLEETTVEHTAPGLRGMITSLRHTVERHHLADVLVAIERTGNYQRPVQRACSDAGFETRLVHPFASKQFREVEHSQDKTDDHDLLGIHLAAVVGFGLIEQPLDETFLRLRLLVRHRRDLVWKMSSLQCQIREHLQATLPGMAELFNDKQFWISPVGMTLARRISSPADVRELGQAGLAKLFRDEGVLCQERTRDKLLAWSEQAIPAESESGIEQRIICDLDDDRLAKKRLIHAVETEIAGLLARTPYVLLMAIPAINVVSAADFAGEAGPISHYATANSLTGRAGIFPSRYQSDEVDRQGKMVRRGNRRLRAALLKIADNLVAVNNYFRGQAQLWKRDKIHPRLQRVRVAKRFTRLAYSMLAGRQIIPHACCREPNYILDKLLAFLLAHQATHAQVRECLDNAAQQLPATAHAVEAETLRTRADEFQHARKSQVQSLGSILREVLAKRLATAVQSPAEG
jgi:transposase